MASLVQRGKRYCVVYTYENDAGEKKQKWETFATKEDALRRKTEVEYCKSMDSIIIPPCDTMLSLIHISLGKGHSGASPYSTETKSTFAS